MTNFVALNVICLLRVRNVCGVIWLHKVYIHTHTHKYIYLYIQEVLHTWCSASQLLTEFLRTLNDIRAYFKVPSGHKFTAHTKSISMYFQVKQCQWKDFTTIFIFFILCRSTILLYHCTCASKNHTWKPLGINHPWSIVNLNFSLENDTFSMVDLLCSLPALLNVGSLFWITV